MTMDGFAQVSVWTTDTTYKICLSVSVCVSVYVSLPLSVSMFPASLLLLLLFLLNLVVKVLLFFRFFPPSLPILFPALTVEGWTLQTP